jgi:hypothetical protein
VQIGAPHFAAPRPSSKLTAEDARELATWAWSLLILSDNTKEAVFFVGDSGGEKDAVA